MEAGILFLFQMLKTVFFIIEYGANSGFFINALFQGEDIPFSFSFF